MASGAGDIAATGAAISLRGVVKRFGPITAVNGLDLEVPEAVCFGLLGPNGAGKSTTMRLLTAQALADEGEISVLGYELPRESKQARLEMGVVPQLDNLDVELTCRQILTVFARLYRIPRAELPAAVDRALDIANLRQRADTIVRELSGGMRRRLLVGRGLIHKPAAGAARRADGRAGPADPPGALVADRRSARARRDGPDEHALHRGGGASGRHRRGDVSRPDHRPGDARRAGAGTRRNRGGGSLRSARAPGRGGGPRQRQRLAQPPQRPRNRDPARRGARRPRAGGRSSPRHARGRVRRAHREDIE